MTEQALLTSGIGAVVGLLIGLTGLGGGVALMPLLIYALKVPPVIAVGSGAVYSAVTKVGAAAVHFRQGTVDLRLVRDLALGSVPGTLSGVGTLSALSARYGDRVNELLVPLIGTVLIVVSIGLLLRRRERPVRSPVSPASANLAGAAAPTGRGSHRPRPAVVLAGALGGFLVGLTSVGAGTVIMTILLLIEPRRPAELVGSDLAHAVVLTGVTGLLHFRMGFVDLPLVGWLLLGSIPGSWLGSRLIFAVPSAWLRNAVVALILISGISMM